MTWLSLALLVGILYVGIRYQMYQLKENIGGLLSDEERTAINRTLNDPLEIPPEWQTVKPFSNEILAARDNLLPDVKIWSIPKLAEGPLPPDGIQRYATNQEGPYLEKLRHKEETSESDWEKIHALIEEASSFSKRLTAFAALSDYDLEAFPGLRKEGDHEEVSSYQVLQIGARRLSLSAHWLAHTGDWENAFKTSIETLNLAKRHPASQILTQLIAASVEIGTCADFAALSSTCKHHDLLISVLPKLLDHKELFNLDILSKATEIDVIGSLREAARNGKAVDLSSGRPGRYYFQQLQSLTTQAPLPNPKTPSKEPSIFDEIFFRLLVPNTKEYGIRMMAAKTYFDLACLTIANRIRQLEGGKKSSDLTGIVPSLLPEEPIDPYAEAPYLWDATLETFYSVGPDKVDGRDRLQYSPTNGAVSNGDLSLR
jgi:hypothetical protein